MKKLLLAILFVPCVLLVAETVWDKALTLAVTGADADATITTAGTAQDVPGGLTHLGVWVTATGTAGTTNGSLVVKFSIYNGTTWTDANNSDIKVTFSTLGNATKTQFEHFWIPGATQIRVGQVENTFDAAVTNLAVRISGVTP